MRKLTSVIQSFSGTTADYFQINNRKFENIQENIRRCQWKCFNAAIWRSNTNLYTSTNVVYSTTY